MSRLPVSYTISFPVARRAEIWPLGQPQTAESTTAKADTNTIPASGPSDVPIEVERERHSADGEEEEDGEGAFNPVTGEINWDCPCLGGMAHGPCGQQFREAFSCFVYSEQEPKGIDCVEKFKNMQDCFREHPDIYEEGECS